MTGSYIAEIGKQFRVEATCVHVGTRTKPLHGMWGSRQCFKFETEDGAIITWFKSEPWYKGVTPEIGKKYQVVAFVRCLSEWEGRAETVVERFKLFPL